MIHEKHLQKVNQTKKYAEQLNLSYDQLLL